MRARAPKVFGIGLPHSGGRALAEIFQQSGYTWHHHLGGKLAQNLAYSQAAMRAPSDTKSTFPSLVPWPNAVGFSGLYAMHKRHLPHLRVQDHIAFLHSAYPDAYFIHTYRDFDSWIAARLEADQGDHRAASAWHAQICEAELIPHWKREQTDHTQACTELFADNPRYLSINIFAYHFEKLSEFLSPEFELTAVKHDASKAEHDGHDRATDITAHLRAYPPLPPVAPFDPDFTTTVATFCASRHGAKGGIKSLSADAVLWRSAERIQTRFGEPAPIIRADDTFLLSETAPHLERVQGTLNELNAHCAKPPLHIDMMDARFIGSENRRRAPTKTVAYNRRVGARNITLWPLPGYHSLAPRGHPGGFPVDKIAFGDKLDRCVWLGNLTGRMSPVLTPLGREARSVYHMRDRALSADPDWADIKLDLDCVPRFRVVEAYRNHPDFEVGLVLRGKWKTLARTPPFAGLCDPFRARTWFHQFRYILSLAGNDTGSNFLSAASSNALILKEEDGWELFYTGAFKPWVHYVPLAQAALDVEEKLAWARANPQACIAMVQAATDLYDRFASPENRAAILRAIAQHLNTLE